jgi:molybdopterin-guanine dinucleotide biosynthesis protein A
MPINPPTIPEDMVQYLDQRYPESSAVPTVIRSEREIWIAVGRREVVRNLLHLHRKQKETLSDVLRKSS